MFYQLSGPTSQHFPNFVQIFRQRNIFLIVQRFGFPKYRYQNLNCVYLSQSVSHEWQFLTTWKEAGCRQRFDRFDKDDIYFGTEGVAVCFR